MPWPYPMGCANASASFASCSDLVNDSVEYVCDNLLRRSTLASTVGASASCPCSESNASVCPKTLAEMNKRHNMAFIRNRGLMNEYQTAKIPQGFGLCKQKIVKHPCRRRDDTS